MPEKKQKLSYYLKLLYPFIRKDKGLLFFGLFAMLITSALRLVDPLILALIIDESIPNQDMAEMLRYGFMFIAVVLVSGLLSYLQIVLLSRLGIKIITKFKGDVFSHLLKLPVGWFNKQPVGELIARVESDSERVKVLFSDLSITIIGNLLFFVGVFVVLMVRDWKTTAIILPIIAITIIAYWFLFRYISRFFRIIREKYAIISAKITDYIQGMQMIQALNQEERITEDLRQASKEKQHVEIKTSFIEYGAQSFFMFVFNVLFVVIVIMISAPKIIAGVATLGTLIVFIQYIYRMVWPLMHLSENFMQMQRSFVSLKRILELTALETEDETFTGNIKPSFQDEIRFDNVSFAYKDEDWILKDVSFNIPKGKKIALVGPSGSGKSTTISLLCGFYHVQRGSITVDGIPIRTMNFRAWRKKIGLILQDIFLFPGPILENVRVYNDNVDPEVVKEALSVVQMDDFINGLPDGLNSELAERGQNVSQGEKQLISFARALAFNSEIIIMDEATASIDPQTEARIQRTMNRVFGGKTLVIVAHRLTSVLDADEILYFSGGRITARGTHQELMQKSEEYRKLVELQLLGGKDE
ncbi:MAG: ABC transporter ATP-binding protein/permease [Candidatus Cloacimonetes bacterium]|jgi:ABC-type multidrug transport system fused ATPase/permease subunit|nr:ABC transporter ATP-binding protein/permease [Candidatus Cloacimonadota bacterium]MCB5278644.1 ABC transporter ATP-binding protein/permease [Candidatus Cloacimonadota bacterium]MCK9333185.1 ABC transporter ATP-binding protein/permease [Candidatus Cloacimonadota bacterium]MDY0299243.1 ABC transporter ATP-binding protein [Candidatus Cloacimonadaceae bacterium]